MTLRPQCGSGSLLSNRVTSGRSFVSRAIESFARHLRGTDRLHDSSRRGSRACVNLIALLSFVAAFASSLPSQAQNAGIPVQRQILVLYDGREEATPDSTRVHRFAEMPLNHLGFVVTYWDVRKGLPEDKRLAGVRGILTWYTSAQARELFVWLQRAAARHIRIAILGDGGYPATEDSQLEANRLFARIGFAFSGSSIDLTYATTVAQRDALIGFEHDLDSVLPQYPVVNVAAADVARHLTLARRQANGSTASTVVLTSPRGGFAAAGYFQYQVPGTDLAQWIVDPFAFFAAAFGPLGAPIPDTTTLSGRRIYFSHIDGDGWNNASRIARFRDRQSISAAVVQQELIEAYPDLPVAIGVIGANVDPRYGNVAAAQKVARELYALPQVEVATHTYTHPFRWPFFEKYERAREEAALGKTEKRWTSPLLETVRVYSERLFPGIARDHRHTETVIADQDPPRAFSNFPFDLDQEVEGAVAASEQLAPRGKRTTLYLWSGDADPFSEAVARTRRLGLRNLNGGDSRFHANAPSIGYVAPISRPVGSERQIYAPNANDYVYMSDDDGRQFGFLYLKTTIEATENPRRLKPIDVYYHMYVGERAVELNSVRRHLDYARSAPLAPIAASQYAGIADGFFSTAIFQIDGSTWRIVNRGELQTVRFDDADRLAIDFAKSIGVIGQQRKGGTLYVALDAAVPDAIIAVATVGVAPSAPTVKPRTPGALPVTKVALSPANKVEQRLPYLVSSRWRFSGLDRGKCGFTVDAQGYGDGEMQWGGLAPGDYRAVLRRSNGVLGEERSTVNDTGVLALAFKTDAVEPVRLEVSCRSSVGAQ